ARVMHADPHFSRARRDVPFARAIHDRAAGGPGRAHDFGDRTLLRRRHRVEARMTCPGRAEFLHEAPDLRIEFVAHDAHHARSVASSMRRPNTSASFSVPSAPGSKMYWISGCTVSHGRIARRYVSSMAVSACAGLPPRARSACRHAVLV